MNFDYSTPTRFNRRARRTRSGLAPLEMVLALPLLMGIMGLMMVFGFVASWKIRSEVVARDVGWRIRNPRSGGLHQRSVEWPELEGGDRSLELSAGGVGILDSVDAQAVVHAPIIRGPLPEIDVNNRLLDLSRNVVRGTATVDQPSQVMGEIGRANYQTQNEFLSEELKSRPMGVGNFARRIPILWNTELDVLYDIESISGTIFAINAFRDPIVLPIDEDMDFYHWNIRLLRSRIQDEFGNETLVWDWQPKPIWPDPASYTFITDHSRLGESDFDPAREIPIPFRGSTKEQYYEDGRERIRSTVVEAYLHAIPRVPRSMAQRSHDLFDKVLRKSESDLVEPRLTASEKTRLEGWRDGLKVFIDQLREQE